MSETGQTTGGPPTGPWRHRPRPVRAIRIDPTSRPDAAPGEAAGAQPPPEACPWLYLATEPNTRAAYVTDAHRCELRQEVVPGPGHQLAYCMTTNHIFCPQLQAYEAQRQAGEKVAPSAVEAVTPPPIDAAPAAVAAAPEEPASVRPQDIGSWLGRGGAAVLGGLAAIVLLGALALLYSSPGTNQAAPVSTTPVQPGTDALPTPTLATATATPTPPPIPTATPEAIAPSATAPDEGEASATEETTTEVTPTASDGPVLVPYIVQPGDTLLIIAATYNVNLDELLAANDLVFNSPIYSGQQLLLPIRVLSSP